MREVSRGFRVRGSRPRALPAFVNELPQSTRLTLVHAAAGTSNPHGARSTRPGLPRSDGGAVKTRPTCSQLRDASGSGTRAGAGRDLCSPASAELVPVTDPVVAVTGTR